MSKDIKVSVSILCADFGNLEKDIRVCEDAGVDMLHIDVMDGHFVPNITIGQIIVKTARQITNLPIETHLMIENPWAYIDDFIDAGSDAIYIHAECYGPRRDNCKNYGEYPKEVDSVNEDQILRDINLIKSKGKKAYVVLSPGTPMCLQGVVDVLDGVLVMSVNPGFANQKFMPIALPKIEELRKIFNGDIAIDGGINKETAPLAVVAGANILATASYFFKSEDKKAAIDFLHSLKQ